MYKLGIIGSGVIVSKIYKILKSCGDFEISAIFSRNKKTAKKLANKYNAKIFDNVEEFLDNKNLYSLVYIATPHSSHYEYIKLCLKEHVPVLVEKPITISSNEIKDVILMNKKYDTYVSEAMWTLHSDIFYSLKNIVHSKKLGKLKEATFSFSVYKSKLSKNNRIFDKNRGGGALLDIGIYLITIAYILFGKPLDIKIKAKMYHEIDLIDKIEFIYKDFIVRINTSINKIKDKLVFNYQNGVVKVYKGHAPKKIVVKYNNNLKRDVIKGKTTYQKEFYDTFNDLDLNNKESTFVKLQDNLEIIKLMDECRNKINLKFQNE